MCKVRREPFEHASVVRIVNDGVMQLLPIEYTPPTYWLHPAHDYVSYSMDWRREQLICTEVIDAGSFQKRLDNNISPEVYRTTLG
jgi:hypothetical protein